MSPMLICRCVPYAFSGARRPSLQAICICVLTEGMRLTVCICFICFICLIARNMQECLCKLQACGWSWRISLAAISAAIYSTEEMYRLLPRNSTKWGLPCCTLLYNLCAEAEGFKKPSLLHGLDFAMLLYSYLEGNANCKRKRATEPEPRFVTWLSKSKLSQDSDRGTRR